MDRKTLLTEKDLPTACPTLTKGPYRYDFGDTGQMTTLLKMHTLGHTFVPSGIYAGGLRYQGVAPLLSLLKDTGLMAAAAYHQNAAFEAYLDNKLEDFKHPAEAIEEALKHVPEV